MPKLLLLQIDFVIGQLLFKNPQRLARLKLTLEPHWNQENAKKKSFEIVLAVQIIYLYWCLQDWYQIRNN